MGGERLGRPILSPPPKSFDLSIDQLVFRFMLLFHSILTFMKDLYQSENQVFNPTRLLVLLHCWVGKDWAGPFFPPSKIFCSFYCSVSLSVYVTLSLYLNTYEWPIPKRESSFQTKHFICTATLWGWERLGRPILSPPPPPPKCSDLSIYLSVFQFMLFFYCIWRLMNDSFQRDNQIFKPKSLLVYLPPKCSNLCILSLVNWFFQKKGWGKTGSIFL